MNLLIEAQQNTVGLSTPKEVVADMLKLLPDVFWKNPNLHILEVNVKNFAFRDAIVERIQKAQGISENQVIMSMYRGVTLSKEHCLLLNKKYPGVYVYLAPGDVERLEEVVRLRLKDMQFDLVVGNPPYNNDAYIDFVLQGHHLSIKYDLWITPAKWQAKSGKKNDDMRGLADYIAELVYYKNSKDIFDIALDGGISYFRADQDVCDCHLVNKIGDKSIEGVVHDLTTFDLELIKILPKLGSSRLLDSDCFSPEKSYYCSLESADPKLVVDDSSPYRLVNQKYNIGIPKYKCSHFESIDMYKCYATHYMNTGTNYFKLRPYEVSTRGNILLYFGTEEQCDSALSFYSSRLVRYLSISSGLGSVCQECFRFVPYPGTFDKVYEDRPVDGYIPDANGEYIDTDGVRHCSLYVKYGLSEDDIGIVEGIFS